MSDYIKSRAKFMENLRKDRWHATYNAALTGLLAFSGSETMDAMNMEAALAGAKEAADLTHGDVNDE